MPKDRFSDYEPAPIPATTSLSEITPDDAADLAEITSALNVGTPGQVRVTMQDGTIGDVFVSAGVVFPLRAARVWATGTTASDIRALF